MVSSHIVMIALTKIASIHYSIDELSIDRFKAFAKEEVIGNL